MAVAPRLASFIITHLKNVVEWDAQLLANPTLALGNINSRGSISTWFSRTIDT